MSFDATRLRILYKHENIIPRFRYENVFIVLTWHKVNESMKTVAMMVQSIHSQQNMHKNDGKFGAF